jgi:hypothetical protein
VTPMSQKRRTTIKEYFKNNCPINEQTGDGTTVGRCWFFLKDGVCPRHGDVKKYLERLPKLTLENDMRQDKNLPLLGRRG